MSNRSQRYVGVLGGVGVRPSKETRISGVKTAMGKDITIASVEEAIRSKQDFLAFLTCTLGFSFKEFSNDQAYTKLLWILDMYHSNMVITEKSLLNRERRLRERFLVRADSNKPTASIFLRVLTENKWLAELIVQNHMSALTLFQLIKETEEIGLGFSQSFGLSSGSSQHESAPSSPAMAMLAPAQGRRSRDGNFHHFARTRGISSTGSEEDRAALHTQTMRLTTGKNIFSVYLSAIAATAQAEILSYRFKGGRLSEDDIKKIGKASGILKSCSELLAKEKIESRLDRDEFSKVMAYQQKVRRVKYKSRLFNASARYLCREYRKCTGVESESGSLAVQKVRENIESWFPGNAELAAKYISVVQYLLSQSAFSNEQNKKTVFELIASAQDKMEVFNFLKARVDDDIRSLKLNFMKKHFSILISYSPGANARLEYNISINQQSVESKINEMFARIKRLSRCSKLAILSQDKRAAIAAMNMHDACVQSRTVVLGTSAPRA